MTVAAILGADIKAGIVGQAALGQRVEFGLGVIAKEYRVMRQRRPAGLSGKSINAG